MQKSIKIPVNEPLISSQAKINVKKALDSGWISSSGEFVGQFESDFAKFIGVSEGISVSNGTAALHIAMLSLGIGPGDEIIVPAFTKASTWMAVVYVGAKPIFVDCELETFNMDVSLIKKKITKKTKDLIAVHIYGHSSDMDAILRIANEYGLFVVEDAAEAHGARYKGRMCGSMGDIGCFSFYGNKIITTGEGGMIVTNNKVLANKMRKFKDLHHSDKRFIHDGIGYNYRLTNIQAAIGCGELKNIKLYLRKKQHIAKLYSKLLKNIDGIRLPITKKYSTNVYWMFAVLIDDVKYGCTKEKLKLILKEHGIDTRDFFYSPNLQPVLKDSLRQDDIFPVTDLISSQGMYLPSGLAISDKDILTVCEVIIKNQNPRKNL